MNQFISKTDDGDVDFLIEGRHIRYPNVDMVLWYHVQRLLDKGFVDAAIRFCSQLSSKTAGIEIDPITGYHVQPTKEETMNKKATTTTKTTAATKTAPKAKTAAELSAHNKAASVAAASKAKAATAPSPAPKPTTPQPALTAAQARNRWVILINKWAKAAEAKGFRLFKVGSMTPAFKCPSCGKPQALLFTAPSSFGKGLVWRLGCPGCNNTTTAAAVKKPIEPANTPLDRAINRALGQ